MTKSRRRRQQQRGRDALNCFGAYSPFRHALHYYTRRRKNCKKSNICFVDEGFVVFCLREIPERRRRSGRRRLANTLINILHGKVLQSFVKGAVIEYYSSLIRVTVCARALLSPSICVSAARFYSIFSIIIPAIFAGEI